MYPGYLAIGEDDPFSPGAEVHEIVNNGRAAAYAERAGLTWLLDCNQCPEASVIVPGGPNFISPTHDPAPWYDVDDPDSYGFFGVVGLEVAGAESSTRQATVTMGLTGGGIIGPTYMGPRTLVVRALAIAADECSLQYGLTWLRSQYNTIDNPCGGDPLTFFYCCPCVCDDETGGGPCWAVDYGELSDGPQCDPDFWPTTYGGIITGPPADDDQWCVWPHDYRYLRTGPPSWSCCIDACVVPYMRQYHNVRVTSGPNVLRHPAMHSCGALAEIEFTIVAADPVQYHMGIPALGAMWLHGDTVVVDTESEPTHAVDPWAVPPELVGAA